MPLGDPGFPGGPLEVARQAQVADLQADVLAAQEDLWEAEFLPSARTGQAPPLAHQGHLCFRDPH